ncbi:MAG TPA: polysaccharide deacetylase family protein [Vicinamibacterales bacterium]|nr:polysaccharide deacetylase family protein [Vicinamibacterales bacterium]
MFALTQAGAARLPQTAAARSVAVTFDDLPIAGVLPRDIDASRDLTRKLLGAVAAHHVPTIGFVNEDKLNAANGVVDTQRVDLLKRWLEAGLELGNHSYSHADLHATALDAFESDVLKGERVTRELMQERGLRLRYFRHPYLHTGRDLEKKAQFERFLAEHGYRVAPVTIDNDEYVFAGAYDRSLARGNASLAARIADAYVPYMESKVEFFERNSRDLFGREIPEVLLVHANMLNAERFGDLASMFERRGYRFITLERALEDEAYRSPDTFVGTGGITWIHRWALTRGMPKTFYAGEPEAPAFVADAARP